MFSKSYYRYCAFFAIATFCEISTFSAFLSGASVQAFEPTINNPAPISTIGGGRRGSDGQCQKDQTIQPRNDKDKHLLAQQLIPLLPPNKFGLTVSSNPTLFAYVPKTSAIAIEFTLENQQGKGIAHQRVPLTSTPSIVSTQFAKTPLEVGKDYKWLISVVCETGDPEDAFSEGIIRRIQPEAALLKQLEKASVIERVYIYTKFGIWHEAIADLANLRLSQPNNNDLKANWKNLLKSSSLEPIADIPLKN
ncbi:MAG: DUF928 domain-containing protein [Pseudanabaena sp.]